ncbi:hypothetical protein PR202_gb28818 [Eleusine coracana subsp. coracana]|uniref:Endonuclease/exonuclease/phosphatase domain-containing protein n=1 Tax=Eleusine coracana subsp. coracana TaxID=191504 RepID=A0AAV5FY07_ELECO|nr:hypothetical protein PR202_gb28818 [Eleusine coracana subsp. coracana]
MLCGVNLDRFDVIDFIPGDFSIATTIHDKRNKMDLKLVFIYGPAHGEGREQFLLELAQICNNNKLPMLIGGAFNIRRFCSDKNKPCSLNKWSDMFNHVINTHELRDLHLNGGKYTWSNNQSNPTLEKLDSLDQ